MITFYKTPPYDLRRNDKSRYDYLSELTLQRIDPEPLKPGEVRYIQSHVYYSPLRRVSQSLDLDTQQRSVPMQALAEVRFDLRKLCMPEEYALYGSMIVRERFVAAFINDDLEESRESLLTDVRSVIKACLHDESVACISHSFKLKLIEAYISTRGELATHPSLLQNYISPSCKTFEFGEGFVVEPEILRKILRKHY